MLNMYTYTTSNNFYYSINIHVVNGSRVLFIRKKIFISSNSVSYDSVDSIMHYTHICVLHIDDCTEPDNFFLCMHVNY